MFLTRNSKGAVEEVEIRLVAQVTPGWVSLVLRKLEKEQVAI
jgi:hypothetical protein